MWNSKATLFHTSPLLIKDAIQVVIASTDVEIRDTFGSDDEFVAIITSVPSTFLHHPQVTRVFEKILPPTLHFHWLHDFCDLVCDEGGRKSVWTQRVVFRSEREDTPRERT